MFIQFNTWVFLSILKITLAGLKASALRLLWMGDYSFAHTYCNESCRRKYEDQEFLKPTLRIKSAARSQSCAGMQVDNTSITSTNNGGSISRNYSSASSRSQRSDAPSGDSMSFKSSSSFAPSRKGSASWSRSSSSQSTVNISFSFSHASWIGCLDGWSLWGCSLSLSYMVMLAVCNWLIDSGPSSQEGCGYKL